MTSNYGPLRTGYKGETGAQNPTDYSSSVKGMGMASTVIGGISQISEGLRAYSMSKINAGIATRQGKQMFADHMASVRQEISSYVQRQAGSGLVRNRDVEWGAIAKGTRDAAEMEYTKDMEAGQIKYEGKMAKIKGITSGINSITSAFTPV